MKSNIILKIILIAGIILYIFNYLYSEDKLPLGIKKPNEGLRDAPQENMIGSKSKDNSKGDEKGLLSGGGFDENGGGSSKGADNCKSEQVSYSIGDYSIERKCAEYNNGCTRKIVNCSALVTNFDENVGGEFEMKFSYFYYEGNNRVEVESELVSKNIKPKSAERFNSSFDFDSSNNFFNKTLNCVVLKNKAPKKKFC